MGLPNLQAPSNYQGAGKAYLLNTNHEYFVWFQNRVPAGTASMAVELSRIMFNAYPWGAAVQVQFSGAPGTFEIDVEASEDDQDATYVQITTITTVNASNVGRASVGFTYPKFIRLKVVTLTNDVLITGLISR